VGEVRIDAANADAPHTANVGDVVVIRLHETPTSGFRWQLDSFDPDVLENSGDEFVPDPESRTGGGGTRVFRFLMRQTDPTDLALSLRRPWETDTSPTESFRTVINAR